MEKIQVKLTTANYWREIDNLKHPEVENIDPVIICLLKGLVGSFLNKTIPPSASHYEIHAVNDIMTGEIFIDDLRYIMSIWVPYDSVKHRQHWRLEPATPIENGRLTTIGNYDAVKESLRTQ